MAGFKRKMVCISEHGFNSGLDELAELYEILTEEYEKQGKDVSPTWVKKQIKSSMRLIEDSIKTKKSYPFYKQLDDGIKRVRFKKFKFEES